MSQTKDSAALAASIDGHLREVGDLWRALQAVDPTATDARLRVSLKRYGVPGGLRAPNQTPLTA